MKKIYTLILIIGLVQQPVFTQTNSYGAFTFDFGFHFNLSNPNFNNTNLNINVNIGNNFNFGDFDFSNINANNCCEEQPLDDISFGYDIGAVLTASALIQKAREKALNQWFDRQRTVLKEEIERQLGQSFSNYNDARNTYFKFHERIGLQRNHTPIENRYNSRRIDKKNKQSISLKNLKLLRLRENEIRAGNINNSSYGNFTYNGISLDQIQNLSQLQNLWTNEMTIFSDNNWRYQNDKRLYYTVRNLGLLQNYDHEIFTDLFNKQLAFYNQYDRWQQLDLMQAFLNEIRPPLALPTGYITPQMYATSQYIEDYAISKHLNTWSADMIFHPYYYQHTTVYQIWMAREGRQEAIERATAYVQGLRDAEIDRLLNEVDLDKIFNELTNTCAKNIFTELENGIFEDHPLKPEVQVPLSSPLTLNFSESILKLFNDSDNTHLTIQNGNTGNSNAYTAGATITIGDTYLANATQLSIARTMIHECVHAYINALYSNVMDFNSFSFREKIEKYASDNGYTIGSNLFHHNFMGQYIDAMAYSLYEWDKQYGTGGNLGWEYYRSMAYSGMFQVDPTGIIATEIDTFIELIPNPNDRQLIANIILNEQKGNNEAQGTECN